MQIETAFDDAMAEADAQKSYTRKQKGSSNWKYAWIPIIGPIIGGVIAALLYRIL